MKQKLLKYKNKNKNYYKYKKRRETRRPYKSSYNVSFDLQRLILLYVYVFKT